jgi:hypothetical protein
MSRLIPNIMRRPSRSMLIIPHPPVLVHCEVIFLSLLRLAQWWVSNPPEEYTQWRNTVYLSRSLFLFFRFFFLAELSPWVSFTDVLKLIPAVSKSASSRCRFCPALPQVTSTVRLDASARLDLAGAGGVVGKIGTDVCIELPLSVCGVIIFGLER